MKAFDFKMGRRAILITALVAVSACKQAAPKTDAIFLVRHAEKTTEKNDPGLTQAGKARALALANRLGGEGITYIHSSDYIRTRDTAEPLAEKLGLEVQIYDPRDLPAIADKLKSTPGRHLVVGHSNTTPPLVELLGGDGGKPIVEATEYDRLYVITRRGKLIESVIETYGD